MDMFQLSDRKTLWATLERTLGSQRLMADSLEQT